MPTLTIADWKTYAAARGQSAVAAATDPDLEAALTRGTASTNGRYGDQFPGAKTGGRAQVEPWPRTGARDRDGTMMADDEIPVEYVYACYEMALRELSAAGSTSPDYTANNQIKKTKESIGPLSEETEYKDGGSDGAQPVYTLIDGIISPILRARALTMSVMAVGGNG
jgi:hypothetical protein